MELVNEMYKYKTGDINLELFDDAVNKLVIVLNPFVPHITEEMWEALGHTDRLYQTSWPAYDEKALIQDEVTIVVQVNGKIKDKFVLANNTSKEETEAAARQLDKVKEALDGVTVVKTIVIPNKIVNFVVR